jgi:hypothetical protein
VCVGGAARNLSTSSARPPRACRHAPCRPLSARRWSVQLIPEEFEFDTSDDNSWISMDQTTRIQGGTHVRIRIVGIKYDPSEVVSEGSGGGGSAWGRRHERGVKRWDTSGSGRGGGTSGSRSSGRGVSSFQKKKQEITQTSLPGDRQGRMRTRPFRGAGPCAGARRSGAAVEVAAPAGPGVPDICVWSPTCGKCEM